MPHSKVSPKAHVAPTAAAECVPKKPPTHPPSSATPTRPHQLPVLKCRLSLGGAVNANSTQWFCFCGFQLTFDGDFMLSGARMCGEVHLDRDVSDSIVGHLTCKGRPILALERARPRHSRSPGARGEEGGPSCEQGCLCGIWPDGMQNCPKGKGLGTPRVSVASSAPGRHRGKAQCGQREFKWDSWCTRPNSLLAFF